MGWKGLLSVTTTRETRVRLQGKRQRTCEPPSKKSFFVTDSSFLLLFFIEESEAEKSHLYFYVMSFLRVFCVWWASYSLKNDTILLLSWTFGYEEAASVCFFLLCVILVFGCHFSKGRRETSFKDLSRRETHRKSERRFGWHHDKQQGIVHLILFWFSLWLPKRCEREKRNCLLLRGWEKKDQI